MARYRNNRYRLKNRAKFLFATCFILVMLAGGGLFAAGFFDSFLYEAGIKDTPPDKNPDGFEGRMNVLVMGVDARKGEDNARTDTMMLCSVDTEKNLVSILSIPRDTRVYIPNHGYEKINAANLYGGPNLAMRTVSDLLGTRVDKYVLTNFEGFKDVVDALGGVTIDVKERMYHYDPEHGGMYTIDLRPGVQRLDGEKALQFVRYRGYVNGDIDRTEQQQQFLAALMKEVMQPSTVTKLPSLVVSTYRMIDTNLSLWDMKKLAVAAGKMTDASLVTQTLPGKFLNTDGGSYWQVDPGTARMVMAAIEEGRSVDNVVLGGITTVAAKNNEKTGSRNNDGMLVPEREPDDEEEQDDQTGTAGTGKSGSYGQTSNAGGKTDTSTKGGKTNTRPGQNTTGTGNSSGKVLPGNLPQTEPPAPEDDDTVVIIPN